MGDRGKCQGVRAVLAAVDGGRWSVPPNGCWRRGFQGTARQSAAVSQIPGGAEIGRLQCLVQYQGRKERHARPDVDASHIPQDAMKHLSLPQRDSARRVRCRRTILLFAAPSPSPMSVRKPEASFRWPEVHSRITHPLATLDPCVLSCAHRVLLPYPSRGIRVGSSPAASGTCLLPGILRVNPASPSSCLESRPFCPFWMLREAATGGRHGVLHAVDATN